MEQEASSHHVTLALWSDAPFLNVPGPPTVLYWGDQTFQETSPLLPYPIMGGFDSQDWQPYYAAHLLLILRRRGAVAMVTERETFNFLSSIIIIYGAICCGKWIQPHLHDW